MPVDERRSYVRHQMISAFSGAVIASFATTPFDVLKTRLQTQTSQQSAGRSTTGILRSMVRNEGVSSLWRGITPSLVMALPATVLYYTAYEQFKKKFRDNVPDSVAPLLAGATSRLLVSGITTPIDLVRTNLQAQGSQVEGGGVLKYSGAYDVFRRVVKQKGIRGLFLGITPSILRDVPFSAVYWGLYEVLHKETLERWAIPGSGWSEFGCNFVSGASAGFVAAVVTMPSDVIKTTMQDAFSTTWCTARSIVKNGGWSALMKGVVPRTLRIVPACAIMISTYQLTKDLLD